MNSGATVDRGMSVTRVSSGGGAADSTLEGGGSMHFSSVGGDGGDCDVPPHSSQQTQSHTDARPQHHPPPQHHPVPSQQAYPNELPLGLNTSTSGMDDVDKLLQAWQQPGQGSFDMPPDLHMDWTLPSAQEHHPNSAPLLPEAPAQHTSAREPQPFAGPISRLGWPTSPPSTAGPPPLALEDPPVGGGTVGTPVHNGGFTSAMHGMHSSASKASGPISTHMGIFGKEPQVQQLGLPPIPRVPPQRMAAAAAEGGPARPGGPLVPPGGGSMLWETRSTPPLWSIGEHRVDGGPGQHMRLALSAGTDEFLLGGDDQYSRYAGAAVGAGVRRLRASVRSASVGGDSDRPLSPSDLEPGGMSGVKAKERNRRAQKRFRERQKMKQQEAVQRVVQLEEQLDRLEVERSDLSHRLQQMTQSGAGTSAATDPLKADDSASEQQQSAPPKSEQVLTLSVPGGLERHLTSSHIKRLTWDEYICLYENYLEEMASMLLQAEGDGSSAAGTRLQRLSTELITVTAAVLMHDPSSKGRLHCMPLMSAPVEVPLAPPDHTFWHRVTLALCLSPRQRQNCLRLRNAHLHKVRDIMQDRLRINAMMQTTLPSFDYEQQAARQHLRALAVSENLQRNLRQEQGLQLELATTFFSQTLTPIQMATAATESYPWWPDILALLTCATEAQELA